MRYIYISILFFFFSSIGIEAKNNNTFPTDSIGSIIIAGKTCVRYLVSPGETIYRISSLYRVPISDLLEMNPELEAGLKVGQIITIPYNAKDLYNGKREAANTNSFNNASANVVEKNTEETKGNNSVHTVQAGETLYSLSRRYKVSVEDLKKWNSFDLKAGQQIFVTEPDIKTSVGNPEKPKEEVKQEEKQKDVPNPAQVAANSPVKSNTAIKAQPVKVIPSSSFLDTASYSYDPSMQQVLIIPFDPYLYFSDADDEMAAASNMHRTKIRQVFRRRMNALLDYPGYENIHLLGGKANDSLSDLNKIYSSVTYNYQEIINNPNYIAPVASENKTTTNANKSWLQKQKEKIVVEESSKKSMAARDNGKYFGVVIRNPEFFNYFNRKYNTDYYIFINQFEVKTNYENCLDRAVHNFDRTFTTHFSIFNSSGKQIAGNKFKLLYNSNSNNVQQIVTENMLKIAERIIGELPTPSR
ncbi:MAG: LysM peptidoglycan-binding domain-containing protein [Cytophagales bacterium]|nr:MAG: LysM peptidoglycan-binding domain-containing protein [Cytophagales bacterium]